MNRLQQQLTELNERERLLLKMFANLLETHYEVRKPQNALTAKEYFKVPGGWELSDGTLRWDR
jgi:hypothetical protein